MPPLTAILARTPPWVWLVFALLLALGIQALRERRVALMRVFLTPAVFITWGLASLALTALSLPVAPLAWALAAAAGGALALATSRLDGLRAAPERRVELPGSIIPLFRNMLIFAAKYGLAVALAIHPESRARLQIWDMAVSGASAGYFIGWAWRFRLAYRRSAEAALPAARGSG
jgi:hypothetical protein